MTLSLDGLKEFQDRDALPVVGDHLLEVELGCNKAVVHLRSSRIVSQGAQESDDEVALLLDGPDQPDAIHDVVPKVFLHLLLHDG